MHDDEQYRRGTRWSIQLLLMGFFFTFSARFNIIIMYPLIVKVTLHGGTPRNDVTLYLKCCE